MYMFYRYRLYISIVIDTEMSVYANQYLIILQPHTLPILHQTLTPCSRGGISELDSFHL
ncbi:hypothetical protein BCR39DRAFT_552423 [Naematelia encephala]|uniref:Uncharacterized protein n=1 Tax=Naematelia encephala TaxID=71784 RepID=A0A1Y2AIM8_9TREE|nr:hypothetical protein BCR39DRAFT_552423 [Naematelia encephala]